MSEPISPPAFTPDIHHKLAAWIQIALIGIGFSGSVIGFVMVVFLDNIAGASHAKGMFDSAAGFVLVLLLVATLVTLAIALRAAWRWLKGLPYAKVFLTIVTALQLLAFYWIFPVLALPMFYCLWVMHRGNPPSKPIDQP